LENAMTSLLLLLASAAAPPPGADDAADAARIARLVRQLGSDDFDEREAATKELEAIGEPALAPLRKAAADLTNRRTHEANHNAVPLANLLAAFRAARGELVRRLESFPDDGLAFTALHPRLKAPMNVVDLAYFVAEHDDYHLARISELLGQAS
jgi:hypothetical protein